MIRSIPREPEAQLAKVTLATMPPAPRDLHGRWTLFKILEGKPNSQIRQELNERYLPCASDAELNARRRAHRRPAGFSLELPLNPVSQCFLLRRNLDRVAAGASDSERAISLLRGARVRELIESALLLGVPECAIVTATKALLETDIDSNEVHAYGDLFFRLELFTRAQVRILVEERVRCTLAGIGTPAATEKALGCDGRMVALSLPATPSSWIKVLVTMGFPSIPRSIEEAIVSFSVTNRHGPV
jgi:hypothetical protein